MEQQEIASTPVALWPALLAVLAFAAATVWGSLGLGPWYDEFYTWYVAQPAFPLHVALVEHWLPDNHPPLFYALARAFWWLGEPIEHKRLINLAFVAAAGWACVALVRRRPTLHAIAAAFLIMLASQSLGIRYAVDYRSYFLSLLAMAVLMLAVITLHCGPAERRRSDAVILWAATIVAFNVHITTSIIAAAVLAPFLCCYLAQRDFARFWRLALPALAGGLLFSAISLVQMQHWLGNTATFWLPAGLSAARWTIEMTLIRALEANLGLLAVGLAGLTLLAVTCLRQRRLDDRLGAAILLGMGTVLATAIIIAVHLWRPFVFERYLLGYIPILGMALALGADALFGLIGRRWTAVALTLCAVLGGVTAWQAAAEARASGSWADTAAFVGKLARECSGTVVHTNPAWNREAIEIPPADNRQVVPMAYAMMARRYDFTLESAGSRHMATACPTVFWAEWLPPQGVPAPQVLADVRAAGFNVSAVTVYRFKRSFVAVAR